MKITATFYKIINHRRAYFHVICHKTEHLLHCTYLGLVFKEAHGYYGYAAGGLLIFVVINMVSSAHSEVQHTEVRQDAN